MPKILLPAEIASYNKLNTNKKETEIYSFAEAVTNIAQEELKSHICSEKWFTKKLINDRDEEYTKEAIAFLEKKTAIDSLPANPLPNYGICVRNSNLRLFPTAIGCYKDKRKAIDYMAVSMLKIGERVICWHKDLSGKWYFVQSKNAWGWVYAAALAMMDEENWLKLARQESMQILAPQMKIDKDSVLLYATRLPYLGIYAQKYWAMLPKRDKWGNVYFKQISFPQNAEISAGSLSLTPEMVLKEGCKFLQEKYDWGAKHGGHDCTSLLSDIFSTFGISLASNSAKMLKMAKVDYWEKNWNHEERLNKLSEINIGSILLFKGHAMLYLGKRGDRESILHSVYRLGQSVNGRFCSYDINKTTIGDLSQYRENGKSLLESIEGSLDLFSFIDGLIS